MTVPTSRRACPVSPAVARTWIRALQATYNTHLHLDEPKCVTMCNQVMNQLLDAVSKN